MQVRPEAELEHFAAVLGAAEQEPVFSGCALHTEQHPEEAEDSDLEASLMDHEWALFCMAAG